MFLFYFYRKPYMKKPVFPKDVYMLMGMQVASLCLVFYYLQKNMVGDAVFEMFISVGVMLLTIKYLIDYNKEKVCFENAIIEQTSVNILKEQPYSGE